MCKAAIGLSSILSVSHFKAIRVNISYTVYLYLQMMQTVKKKSLCKVIKAVDDSKM